MKPEEIVDMVLSGGKIVSPVEMYMRNGVLYFNGSPVEAEDPFDLMWEIYIRAASLRYPPEWEE